jgi:hypothetical protein
MGTARMGKTRENNANKIKVSLYIVNRRLEWSKKAPRGSPERMKVRRDAKLRWRKRSETRDFIDVGLTQRQGYMEVASPMPSLEMYRRSRHRRSKGEYAIPSEVGKWWGTT